MKFKRDEFQDPYGMVDPETGEFVPYPESWLTEEQKRHREELKREWEVRQNNPLNHAHSLVEVGSEDVAQWEPLVQSCVRQFWGRQDKDLLFDPEDLAQEGRRTIFRALQQERFPSRTEVLNGMRMYMRKINQAKRTDPELLKRYPSSKEKPSAPPVRRRFVSHNGNGKPHPPISPTTYSLEEIQALLPFFLLFEAEAVSGIEEQLIDLRTALPQLPKMERYAVFNVGVRGITQAEAAALCSPRLSRRTMGRLYRNGLLCLCVILNKSNDVENLASM